jgi:glycosyltransferase involved in cell wall biosynthesis
MNTSLTIVFSTRKINPDFVKHLERSSGLLHPEIIATENNGELSLNQVYNMGIEKATNDIIVFCHDDINFQTDNWGRKVLKHFHRNPDYAILGAAGTNNLLSGMWWEDRAGMHGIVNHTDGTKVWTSRFSPDQGNKVKQMIVLDGVFFAIDKTKIIHKFDETFTGFHFYDLAFCFPNYLAGVKLGVFTDIRVTHQSVGIVNEQWHINRKQFEGQYKDHIPCKL